MRCAGTPQRLILLLAISTMCRAVCRAQQNCVNCGVLIVKEEMIHPETGRLVYLKESNPHKIWYKDSIVILEAQVLEMNNIFGVESVRVYTDHYTFIDLRRRWFYEYTSFSDTARLIAKYTQPDSAYIRGCWKFYAYSNIAQTKNLEVLPDTVMNGVTLKRYRNIQMEELPAGRVKATMMMYMRCDLKNNLFHMDRAFNEKTGCVMVRWDYGYDPPYVPTAVGELEFAASTLTKEELKVFAAWEKNMKTNPVTGK